MNSSVRRMFILLGLVSGLLIMTFAINTFSVLAEEIPCITPEELKKLIENKADIVVVDNQPKVAYDMGHLPEAVNFPWASEIRRPVNLPRDKVLILYCACAHEEDSADVADQLIKNFGYKNIKLLKGGLLQWLKLGYPIEKKD